uniref:Dienelactone hydrolase domain-containing protein n=1 Tax=Salix viminalis TaxID=40686 RepID=A0A6N2LPH2_SALVM
MEQGQSKNLVALKPMLLVLQIPSLPSFSLQMLMDKVKEDAKSVIATLKSKGVNSIGAAGFCWGGNVAVKLASSSNDIQAAVILHPGPLTIDEIKGKDSNCCSGS